MASKLVIRAAGIHEVVFEVSDTMAGEVLSSSKTDCFRWLVLDFVPSYPYCTNRQFLTRVTTPSAIRTRRWGSPCCCQIDERIATLVRQDI